MKLVYGCVALFAALVGFMLFGETTYQEVELARFAVNGPVGLSPDLAEAPVAFDLVDSSDGRGSLRIDAEAPLLVNLADVLHVEPVDVSFRQLLYEAKVKTRDTTGPVFLVMQAGIGGGSMPVVGSERLQGDQDWTTLRATAGNPGGTALEGVTVLQVEVQGSGTVWVDDLRLVSRQPH